MIALVLLPGLDGTGLQLTNLVASFGSEVKIIVASYPTNVVLDYPELESIARSFLPQDQPFILLGESFSGPIAISIAASRPPGLRGLVLCCSFARNPLPSFAALRPLLCIAPVASLPLSLLSFFVLGRFSSPALRQSLAESLAQVSPSVLRARVRAVLSVDRSAALSRIDVPMLYLRAAEDRLVPRSASQEIVGLAPATKVVEFSAPHFLLQVLPSQAATTIHKFSVTIAPTMRLKADGYAAA
ncbi:MAG: lysophospholipase [Rhodanobacter sp.]|jgi:pimeloyl-ACP methyl ester carboxylesterase|nr:lysophospholipase [Rhodanobacter sp.]